MKREKYSFFLSLSLSLFLFPFLSNTKLIPALSRHGFSSRDLFGLGETWPLSRVTLGDFRARTKERKKEKERRRKGGKNARRHPLETKFFRKRISLFGSELCPLSQVFTIRAWGSIEWRRRGYRTVDIDAAIDSILRVKKSRVDARNLFNRVD